ncbi:MAG: tRNA dihydrouridine synthase DusB [Deltaproteobacteria bacterium]|nr:tRNA dihydrouridine synthase DusB [Deltaproteobacteria bacterium]MBM4322803.1 tRNA dihydrouridine synthase DusB [Deltaproteobacteria bacterium]MBM4346792.1 tRNA dihydrouridine synthase DusB [Deltaproteobacteria bacterium]
MRLGNLQLKNNLFLAPMAGITDFPFRELAREHGCDLTFTEMVSAEGLLRKGKAFLKIGNNEHPISVQLFGANSTALVGAAVMAQEMEADAIDLNMGCPAKQVVKVGAGVALMRFPEKVKEILLEMRKRITCPLTVKIRSGWDEKQINAVEISKLAEDCGVDAITVHPRTKEQAFRDHSDWNVITEVKKAVRIPVIGNGDVTAPYLIQKMFKETRCDGVMIGRGVLGNPWIFSMGPSGSAEEKRQMIQHHYSLIQTYYGEEHSVHQIRKHLYWYTKGLPNCAVLHSKLSSLKRKETLFEAIHLYFESIQRRDECQSKESSEARSVTG